MTWEIRQCRWCLEHTPDSKMLGRWWGGCAATAARFIRWSPACGGCTRRHGTKEKQEGGIMWLPWSFSSLSFRGVWGRAISKDDLWETGTYQSFIGKERFEHAFLRMHSGKIFHTQKSELWTWVYNSLQKIKIKRYLMSNKWFEFVLSIFWLKKKKNCPLYILKWHLLSCALGQKKSSCSLILLRSVLWTRYRDNLQSGVSHRVNLDQFYGGSLWKTPPLLRPTVV